MAVVNFLLLQHTVGLMAPSVEALMSVPGDLHDPDVEAVGQFLMEKYGVLLGRKALAEVLHFPTVEAFDRHVQRGRLGLKTVQLEGRRGVYAMAIDVARYLCREAPVTPSVPRKGTGMQA